MAKRIIDGGEAKPKKKRSCCCSCCIAFVCFTLVLCAAVFGVGWYFGDKFAKQYFDMSVGDVLGVMGGLYWTDDDVVDRPFDAADKNGFYSEIKKTLFLKSDAEVDFDKAIETAIKNAVGGVSAQQSADTADAEGLGEADGGGFSLDFLIDTVAEVFIRENIDTALLSAYSEATDNYVFVLQDVQLAAFIDHVYRAAAAELPDLGDDDLKNLGLDFGDMTGVVKNLPIADLIELKQIKIDALPKTDEMGVTSVAATSVSATLRLGLEDIAAHALDIALDKAGVGWASGFAKFFGNLILPENLYITATVPIDGEGAPQISVNDMNEKKRAGLYKIVDAVFKMTGGDDPMTVAGLMDKAKDAIAPFTTAAAEYIDGSEAKLGKLRADVIATGAKLLSDTSELDDPVTKPEIMRVLKLLLCSDADAKLAELEPYLYDRRYRNADGKEIYLPSGADTTGYTRIDYEAEFIDAIEKTYMLDFGDNATLSGVLSAIGVSFGSEEDGGDTDIIELIDAKRFHASLDEPIEKLKVTDRMLAAALGGNVDKLLSSAGESLSGLELGLDALTFVTRDDRAGHIYARLAVHIEVDSLTDMFGDIDEKIVSIIKGILPEKLLLSVDVDITQSLSAGDCYDPPSFMINDFTETDAVIDTVSKILPDFDIAEMAGGISDTVRETILSLDEMLGIELIPSVSSDGETLSGAVVLPDIYTVVVNTVLIDDDGPVVTAEELKNVLKGLDDTSGFEETGDIPNGYDGFIADVTDKYYLDVTKAAGGKITTFAELTDFLAVGADGFDSSKFRLVGKDPDTRYLAYDDRSVEELEPVMTAKQLAALIKQEMTGNAAVSDFEIVDIETSVAKGDKLIVTLAIDTGELLPKEIVGILNSERMFVTASVDLSATVGDGETKPYAYPVSLNINNMSDETFADAMKIISVFAKDFDIQAQVDEFGVILYEQLDSLMSGLGRSEFIEFTDDGLKLISFYGFLADRLGLENGDPELVKAAIQGLYEEPSTGPLAGNPYNYSPVEFIVNAPNSGDCYDPAAFLSGEEISDRQFNGFFESVLEGSTDGAVNAVQTVALAANNRSDRAEAFRSWLNARLKDDGYNIIEKNGEYLAITFGMKITDFSAIDNASGATFMPENVFATVVLRLTEKDGRDIFERVGMIFNDMDKAAYEFLLELMGMKDDDAEGEGINIAKVTEDCMSALNKLGENGSFVLGETNGDIGSIGFVRSGV